MIEELEGQATWFDQDSWFGKMSPEPSQATAAKTSKPSSRKSSASQNRKQPMFLCLKDGLWLDASQAEQGNGVWLGAYTTRSFGERPNMLTEECGYPALPSGVEGSRLSQILVDSALPKYYLSAKACQGILTRAEKRKKELPEILKAALTNQATQSVFKNEPENLGGGQGNTDSE